MRDFKKCDITYLLRKIDLEMLPHLKIASGSFIYYVINVYVPRVRANAYHMLTTPPRVFRDPKMSLRNIWTALKFNNKCVGGEHKKYISLHTTLHIIDDSDRTRHGRPVSSRKCQDYDFHEPMLGVFNGQSVEKINVHVHVHLSTKFVIGKLK